MALTILGRSQRIAKRWPYKALNFLPNQQIQNYLAWKSRIKGEVAPFHLGNAIFESHRILILLPDTFPEILLTIPVLQSLVQNFPEGKLQLLVDDRFTSFLASLFGPESVVGWVPENFYWGESHFNEVENKTQGFKPQLAISLRQNTSVLLGYIIRVSQAPLRVQIVGHGELDSGFFANITLRAQTPTNHLRRLLLLSSLWNFSDRPIECKWTCLKPGKEHLQEASARLIALGLTPENTLALLWQGPPSPFQQEILLKALTTCQGPGKLKSRVILWASGAPFSDTVPPLEATQGIPCLEVESTGLLLGFLDLTTLAIGLNGPLLHLASLTDTDVEAHFEAEDAPWDASFLNPRMRVIYRNQ